MFPYNVRNTNANLGFSLIEIMVTLAVVGALAAIGIPGFFQMRQRFEVNSAFDQVRGAIKESQLQAIRLSKTCTIRINESARTIAIDNAIDDQDCLINPLTLPNKTRIRTNNGIVRFTFQGNTNTMQTIVVSDESRKYNKCLVISNGIGMMRWGAYNGNPNANLDPRLCENQNV